MEHKVKLQPFTVPNFVIQVMQPGRREDGPREAPSYHLSELDDQTLTELCDQFRDAVFAKAHASREV